MYFSDIFIRLLHVSVLYYEFRILEFYQIFRDKLEYKRNIDIKSILSIPNLTSKEKARKRPFRPVP